MHETDPLSMVQVLGTRHMFQYITLLELDFNVDDYSIEPLDMWMITTFFPVLSNMPHLCNFSLKILRLYETLTVIKPPVLEILSALPLQSVTLGTMECPLSPWPDNFEIAWSLVTKLSMPNQALSLDFLHHFAALPKLEYLELKLDVQWLFAPTIPEPGPRAPLHTLVSTYNEPEDRNFSSAYRIAQWLLSHWPNLSRMVCPDPIPTDDPTLAPIISMSDGDQLGLAYSEKKTDVGRKAINTWIILPSKRLLRRLGHGGTLGRPDSVVDGPARFALMLWDYDDGFQLSSPTHDIGTTPSPGPPRSSNPPPSKNYVSERITLKYRDIPRGNQNRTRGAGKSLLLLSFAKILAGAKLPVKTLENTPDAREPQRTQNNA
ncbi:hypothetical protein BDV93DRAFT_546614 [Ceratobasidium sp. AG-I]|nr:hypothetical protein BDV93DRAFT_546614 [Ceratobasidium sp. AG-I]